MENFAFECERSVRIVPPEGREEEETVEILRRVVGVRRRR